MESKEDFWVIYDDRNFLISFGLVVVDDVDDDLTLPADFKYVPDLLKCIWRLIWNQEVKTELLAPRGSL
jgi:hypothetical protein